MIPTPAIVNGLLKVINVNKRRRFVTRIESSRQME